MPTTDERREVAARLQDMANERGRHDRALFFASLIDALSMEGRASVGEILNRLADLIEPSERTCRNISLKAHKGVFCCSECEIHVDIALMDSIDDYLPSFCPNCGCRVKEG